MERETKLQQLQVYEHKYKEIYVDLQEINAVNLTLKNELETQTNVLTQGDKFMRENKVKLQRVADDMLDRQVNGVLTKLRNFGLSQKIDMLSYDEMAAIGALSKEGLGGVVVKYFQKDPLN